MNARIPSGQSKAWWCWIVVFACATGCNQEADRLRAAGEKQLRCGHYKEAVNVLSRALQIDTQDPSIFRMRAVAFHQLGKFKLAINDLNAAIDLDCANEALYVERAVVYLHAGDVRFAINDADRAIEMNPSNPSAYVVRGLARLANLEFSGSKSDFDVAIRLDPALGSFQSSDRRQNVPKTSPFRPRTFA